MRPAPSSTAIRSDRPRAGDGVLCDTALPRRGRVGIAGRTEQRPAQPALPLCDRRRVRQLSDRTVRALVTASFVTPPFLGAVAWELLAAPNSGLLNQLYRYATGAESDSYQIGPSARW